MRVWQWLTRRNRDLDDEIQAHLQMAIRDRIDRGESPHSAHLAALREFGNEGLVKEVTRETWRWSALERLFHDLRHAARMLRQNPGFTAVVVLTLALGVGANTAIFSVVHALLNPLPVLHPERVVIVWTENAPRQWHEFPASIPDYNEWQASGLFSAMGAYADAGFNLRLGDRTDRIGGASVNKGFFDTLGIRPEIGRLFEDRDMQPGADPAVALSYSLWQKRFAGDKAVIGTRIVLNATPRTIIGVLPKSFSDLGAEEIYEPTVMQHPGAELRGSRTIAVFARLRPGISLATAQKEMSALAGRQARQYPEDADDTVVLQPIEEAYVEDARTLILILQGAVLFVLLIACANIANLLMARGTFRAREMTIRAALGASRWKLIRQLLTESLLLALIGGVLAIVPAYAGIQFIASFKLDELPEPGAVTLNWSVLAFNFLLTVVTGLFFGMLPAWQAGKARVGDALKSASRTLSSGPHQRLRSVLVVSEIALTLVLLMGAGLMLQSYVRMRAVWPGYNPHGVYTSRIELGGASYESDEKRSAFFSQAVARIQSIPGVRVAAAAGGLPGSDDYDAIGLYLTDKPATRTQDVPVVFRSGITADYFAVMQIPVLRGRAFRSFTAWSPDGMGLVATDAPNGPLVVIVDEWTAHRFWPNQDPVGKKVFFGDDPRPREIVGVIGTVDQGPLTKLIRARSGQFYLPISQYAKSGMSILLRTNGDPMKFAPAVRRVVRELDADQPVFQEQSLDAYRATGRATQKLAAWLLGAFGCIALLIATIGVYGVMAYSVGCRTHEFGIRMSLGAQPRDVMKLVARQAILMNIAGIAAGVASSYALTRLLESLLYKVRATDPFTFIAVTVFLAAVTLLAGYFPARRATQLDPVRVLRDE